MVAALYLLSTLASWSAIACLITAIAKIGGRRRSVEWFVWSGLLFTLSAFAGRPVLRTFGLPVVWPILPFTLWLTLILCAFSVLLIGRGALEGSLRKKLKQAIWCWAGAVG